METTALFQHANRLCVCVAMCLRAMGLSCRYSQTQIHQNCFTYTYTYAHSHTHTHVQTGAHTHCSLVCRS